jgi:hypothetical protein
MKWNGKVFLPLVCLVLTTGMGAAQQWGPAQLQSPAPLHVNGQILMDTGQPVFEPVSVAFVCGGHTLQVTRTDLKGYFQFDFGTGPHANMDMSFSDDAPIPWVTNSLNLPQSCELEVMVPGYQPLLKTISELGIDSGLDSEIDVGPLQLERIAGVVGSAISANSLLVPSGARKEFDKGDKEVRSNHLELATQHLERAVAEYEKYAAAWNELGVIYSENRDVEKSRQAFGKAIAADPHYIPPYVGLAALELRNEEYESAVETAGRALELDPRVGLASFIQAAANFKLNRLDSAEKSARDAEEEPYQNIPELHVLLAAIFMAKQDGPNAAAQMRAYLKEFPQGKFAGQMKTELKQIEQSTGERR